MRIVLDCNVVISAGLTTHGTCHSVLLNAIQHHTIIVTNSILAEYRTVATRRKFFSFRDILLKLIYIIEVNSFKVEDQTLSGIILNDINDLIYIYAGINSNCKFLVTGNLKDFPDRVYMNLEVISPTEFLLKTVKANTITDIIIV